MTAQAGVLDKLQTSPLSSDYHPHTACSRGQREATAQASGGSYARNGATTQISPERVLMVDRPGGRRQRRRHLLYHRAPPPKAGSTANINGRCTGVLRALYCVGDSPGQRRTERATAALRPPPAIPPPRGHQSQQPTSPGGTATEAPQPATSDEEAIIASTSPSGPCRQVSGRPLRLHQRLQQRCPREEFDQA
jgi:hypothetical protein